MQMRFIWSAIQVPTFWIYTIVLLVVFVIHSARLHYINKAHQQNGNNFIKFLWILDVRHISYFVITPLLLIMIINVVIIVSNQLMDKTWTTDTLCSYWIRFCVILAGIAKCSIHLFIALRSKVGASQLHPLWYKVGLLMIFSDVLFVIYVSTPIVVINAVNDGCVCSMHYASKSIFIWFGLSDFIIGSYCLLVFVLPLRNIIKMEAKNAVNLEHNDRKSLYVIVRKIIIYSSISIISTMMFTVISMNVQKAGSILFNLDNVINSICVVLQFADVDIRMVPKSLAKLCQCIQCNWKEIKQSVATASIKDIKPEKQGSNANGLHLAELTDGKRDKNTNSVPTPNTSSLPTPKTNCSSTLTKHHDKTCFDPNQMIEKSQSGLIITIDGIPVSPTTLGLNLKTKIDENSETNNIELPSSRITDCEQP